MSSLVSFIFAARGLRVCGFFFEVCGHIWRSKSQLFFEMGKFVSFYFYVSGRIQLSVHASSTQFRVEVKGQNYHKVCICSISYLQEKFQVMMGSGAGSAINSSKYEKVGRAHCPCLNLRVPHTTY